MEHTWIDDPADGGPAHFHSDACIAFVTAVDPGHGVAEGESTDLRWYTLEQLRSDDAVLSATERLADTLFQRVLPTWERIPATQFGT